jgi:hypothetical protein
VIHDDCNGGPLRSLYTYEGVMSPVSWKLLRIVNTFVCGTLTKSCLITVRPLLNLRSVLSALKQH